jgi:Na+-driven multidrug efflux pump
MPFRMLNALFIVAIFRSGGDTKYALFLDVTGVWLIGIPAAVLGGMIFHLPVYYVYGLILIEEFYKLLLNKLHGDPTNSIMIDDNIKNIEAAKSIHMNTIHFETAQKLEEDLKKFNLL